jgi:hypothetical protein
MEATEFESRHRLLLHQAIVGAAFLTYLIDPDDVVWRFIKHSPMHLRERERLVFTAVTVLFGVAACLCTWSHRAPRAGVGVGRTGRLGYPGYLGEFLYAVGLASLAPLSGCCLLIAGDGLRLLRLARRERETDGAPDRPCTRTEAFRREALKWGLFVSMIAFTCTLNDRLAETLIAASVLVWTVLQARVGHALSAD